MRTQDEIDEQGTIDAANVVIIPLQNFIEEKVNWPTADAKIVVYCGSGHCFTIAATILWTYGYKDVTSLKGGFSGWKDAGYPVAKP
ncbi:MAG: hypothetical protein OHK0052_08660 [Anaerolineales bacterium]